MIICTPIPNNYTPIPNELDIIYYQGADVWINRNLACREALSNGEDLLLLDSDVVIDKEQIEALRWSSKRYNAVVSGAYVSRRSNRHYEAGFFKNGGCPVDEMIEAKGNEVHLVDYVGGGCLYIPIDILRQLEEPIFFPIWEPVQGSDDIGFCYKLKQKNIPLYVANNILTQGAPMQQKQQQIDVMGAISEARIRTNDSAQAVEKLVNIMSSLGQELVYLQNKVKELEAKPVEKAKKKKV